MNQGFIRRVAGYSPRKWQTEIKFEQKEFFDSRQDNQTNLSVNTTMLIMGEKKKSSLYAKDGKEKKTTKQYRPLNITNL